MDEQQGRGFSLTRREQGGLTPDLPSIGKDRSASVSIKTSAGSAWGKGKSHLLFMSDELGIGRVAAAACQCCGVITLSIRFTVTHTEFLKPVSARSQAVNEERKL